MPAWWASRPHFADLLASGGAAGIVNTCFVTPIDQLKIAQQIHKGRVGAMGFISTASTLLRNHAGRPGSALFGAWRVTLLREICGYSIYFAIYELLTRAGMRLLLPATAGADAALPLPAAFLTGGLTGTLMWGMYFPVDVVKSKQQAAVSRFKGVGESRPVPTLTKLVRRMWAAARISGREDAVQQWNRGLRPFYRGLTPALLRAFPAHGSVFLGYEATLRLLDVQR